MAALIDMTGQRFVRLLVLERHPENDPWGQTRWVCKCDCGNTTIVTRRNLVRKEVARRIVSCGCYDREYNNKHNYRKSPERNLPRGVYYIRDDKFRASITVGCKTQHIGYFGTVEEARSAYVERAEAEDGS